MESDPPAQACPACGVAVDLTNEEPLARIPCPNCGEKFRVEQAFDHFVLLETLGVGGMGSVYKARDTRLDRLVALKILRKELSANLRETRRLEQEERATAAVNHPHVVQVFSSGIDHDQFYLVMELVDHGSLDDLMAERGSVPEAEVVEVGIQIARGLQAAHKKGLIHRDIKPGNILFADERTAKIGDFGLAVAAEQNAETANEIWGTPYYVAPERLNNEPEDFRSDIYSLGATLFHAIAGRPPIEGETNSASALRDLKNQPLNLAVLVPGLKRETVRTITRMIAPRPDQRFATYDELIRSLQRAQDAVTGRRGRQLLATGALVVAVAAASVYFHERKSQQQRRAQISAANESSLRNLYEDARREDAGANQSARKPPDKEAARWNGLLATYKKRVAAYDFAGALTAITTAQLTDPALKEQQRTMEKKARWLIAWRDKLIADLNSTGYPGPVTDVSGTEFKAPIVRANASRMTLRTPYGIIGIDWQKLTPKMLLTLATAFIKPSAPDAADRQWLSGVFANETGQTESARELGTAAAKAKPEYHDQLENIMPQGSSSR